MFCCVDLKKKIEKIKEYNLCKHLSTECVFNKYIQGNQRFSSLKMFSRHLFGMRLCLQASQCVIQESNDGRDQLYTHTHTYIFYYMLADSLTLLNLPLSTSFKMQWATGGWVECNHKSWQIALSVHFFPPTDLKSFCVRTNVDCPKCPWSSLVIFTHPSSSQEPAGKYLLWGTEPERIPIRTEVLIFLFH